MNEWQFTSDVAKWIALILDKNLDLPFGEAYCEGQNVDSRKRRDLTIKDRNGRIVLTGEVKLPGKKDGATPYNTLVVADARAKAKSVHAPFFFTWNVNECVLWETETHNIYPRPDYKRWHVTDVHKTDALAFPDIQAQIKKWLAIFLRDVGDILRGASVLDKKSPDEKFIDALEAALATPVALTLNALVARHGKKIARDEIDQWVRDELGFVIVSDPDGIRNNLVNAAKHACYALANKLVFYEALLKRYGASLPVLTVPNHITAAEPLRNHFEAFFAQAKKVTHDYETVFGENALGFGSRVPFYNDAVVDFWRAFVEEINDFDFSRLDYEIVGNIFERLISPEERHKFGQFYTKVEVVDLINSFAIRTGEESVLDPACGGGTFLVRAYVRKRELAPYQTHAHRLRDLYGVDISSFATHLTTINLATRDLIDDENYPQVARSDFFNIRPHSTIVSLPHNITASGLGKTQRRNVHIPSLDAIVGNPPYIRQEDISKTPKGQPLQSGTKEFYQQIANDNGANLSARSDIHCYFWPHSFSFLKDQGFLCFLTSSQWLDTDYGFKLQQWILHHFEIVAVLESLDEPWFVGARVVTTATILRRQKDTEKRMSNLVRFVQLRKPLSEILIHDATTAGAILSANRFRDELLALDQNTANVRYRARLVQQGDLWHAGVNLSIAIRKRSINRVDEDSSLQVGEYYGGKWGINLRAPDLWFRLLDHLESSLVPLVEIAEVRFGVKSGKDVFFFPKDDSQRALKTVDPDEFHKQYGVKRDVVASGKVKIVLCGEQYGESHPIESCYLEPEIHSIMGLDQYDVKSEDCQRLILLLPGNRDQLVNTYAWKYVEWGESRGYHDNPTCKGRVTDAREWYDLTDSPRASVILPKIQQYRLFTILNRAKFYQASALLGVIDINELSPTLLAALLNSTISVLSRILHARILGNEGNIQLDVYSAEMMLVPDPRNGTEKQRKRVADAFAVMKDRPILGFLSERRLRHMNYVANGKEADLLRLSNESELTQLDRRELDDAILELLGISSKSERQKTINELYNYLADFFEWTRQKEEKAIQNKRRITTRKTVRPDELAREIMETIQNEYGTLLRSYDDFIDLSQPYDTYEIPVDGDVEKYYGLFERHAVRVIGKKHKLPTIVSTKNEAQQSLLLYITQNGIRGFVRVPVDEDVANMLNRRFTDFVERRTMTIQTLVEERTADPEMQDRVIADLMKKISG